jgi:WD40 repeat protein
MTTVADMLKGGNTKEPAFEAGRPDEALLIEQITPQGDKPALMPKGSEALKPFQVDLIKRWIAEGGADDSPANALDDVDAAHPPTYIAAPVVTSLDYSPDGALLAVSGYHEVLLHKTTPDSPSADTLVGRLVGIAERIESAVFSPDGGKLAVTGGSPGRFGEVQIWDVAKRELLLSVPATYDTLYGASWSSDGAKICFGCADNTVRIIDAATGKQLLYQGAHSDWVRDTVFSVDNSHVVSVSRDMSMKLTEVATERFVDNVTSITPGALKGGLLSVARHPTRDELLIGGSDGIPKIYQMHRTQARQIGDDFNRIARFAVEPMAGRIFSVQYSGDGTKVAVGASSDGNGEVRVFNEADGKLLSTLASQFGAVYAVAFRRDGQQVAVGGFDGSVRLYHPETGELQRTFVPVPLTPQTIAAVGN